MLEKKLSKGNNQLVWVFSCNRTFNKHWEILPENFNRDKGLDQIRNMFSMTTKCLDQIGRAGAFHHITRRTVTMSDTSLYELDDAL